MLRQGIKPSVAAVRDQLGGGSPNTLTPLLSKYWETLGQRLGAGPESLDRVPESLARVTELLWRRALEEAREVHEAVSAADDALKGRGRVLVRPSGTEPLVRVMVEAPTDDEAEEV